MDACICICIYMYVCIYICTYVLTPPYSSTVLCSNIPQPPERQAAGRASNLKPHASTSNPGGPARASTLSPSIYIYSIQK